MIKRKYWRNYSFSKAISSSSWSMMNQGHLQSFIWSPITSWFSDYGLLIISKKLLCRILYWKKC